MLRREQVPSSAIEAAIEEYEAASLSGLSNEDSFAAIIAAAIERWPGVEVVTDEQPARIALPLALRQHA